MNAQFQQEAPVPPQSGPSSGTKKAVIIGSIAVVVIGLGVAAFLVYRARVLGDAAPPVATPGQQEPVSSGGGNGAGATNGATGVPLVLEPPPPAHVCGDGICAEGETAARCAPDCGSDEERFMGSIRAKSVTATSLTMTWKTETPSTGMVSYGTTERYELGSVSSEEAATSHAVPITGLSPGTDYYVRVQVTEENGSTWDAGPLLYETQQ